MNGTTRTAHCTGALIDQHVIRLHEALQVAVTRQGLQLLPCNRSAQDQQQYTVVWLRQACRLSARTCRQVVHHQLIWSLLH